MELGFITKAMQRYWWVVAVCLVLGVAGGLYLERDSGQVYEAQSLILVSPAGSTTTPTASTDDRYITSQIVLFESGSLAEAVAQDIGGGATGPSVRRASTFAQIPNTDIVRVTVQSDIAEYAHEVANGYIDAYLRAVRTQLDESQTPELDAIEDSIADIEDQLQVVNEASEDALEPHVPQGAASVGEVQAIPDLEQVDPALATQRQVLTVQYEQLLQDRNSLELGTGVPRVTSRVFQRAALPTEPVVQGGKLLLVAAPMGGLMLGALGAVLLARFSSRVLDSVEVSEVLGLPMAGEMPRVRSLVHRTEPTVEKVPASVVPMVRELCVQAESEAPAGGALTVVVAGTDRSAGATTLAAAMAAWYASAGSDVLLIDADPSEPELTREYAPGSVGIAGLLAAGRSNRGGNGTQPVNLPIGPVGQGGVTRDHNVVGVFARTGVDRLSIVGLGDDPASLRRHNVVDMVETAGEYAQIVVFDGGPLMEAASTVQLAQLADAVIVAVPVKWQRRNSLRVIGRQLTGTRGLVLPVAMYTPHRHQWPLRRPKKQAPSSPRAAKRAQPQTEVEEPRTEESVSYR